MYNAAWEPKDKINLRYPISSTTAVLTTLKLMDIVSSHTIFYHKRQPQFNLCLMIFYSIGIDQIEYNLERDNGVESFNFAGKHPYFILTK